MYVRDANEDEQFIEELDVKFRHTNGPRIYRNWHRLVGQVLFGVFYRGLIFCAIPWDSSVIDWASLVIPLGTAFGTFMVSNVGRQKSSFSLSLIGAYVGEFLFGEPHLILGESNPVLAAIVAMAFSTYGWEWRRERESVSCRRSLLVGLLIYGVFIGLCSSYVYFNMSVETEDGETIKVRDAINNFFTSPLWQELKTALWGVIVNVYEAWKAGGFRKAWQTLVNMADIQGEDHAYDVLGVERGAEWSKVRQRYKQLAKEWHPDHHQGEDMKQKAQEKFMEYQSAYKTLEAIRKRRKKYGDDGVD